MSGTVCAAAWTCRQTSGDTAAWTDRQSDEWWMYEKRELENSSKVRVYVCIYLCIDLSMYLRIYVSIFVRMYVCV